MIILLDDFSLQAAFYSTGSTRSMQKMKLSLNLHGRMKKASAIMTHKSPQGFFLT